MGFINRELHYSGNDWRLIFQSIQISQWELKHTSIWTRTWIVLTAMLLKITAIAAHQPRWSTYRPSPRTWLKRRSYPTWRSTAASWTQSCLKWTGKSRLSSYSKANNRPPKHSFASTQAPSVTPWFGSRFRSCRQFEWKSHHVDGYLD